MKVFKGFLIVIMLLLMETVSVWAQQVQDPQQPTKPDAEISVALTHALYCDVKGLLEGNIGLIIGLLMVFAGIWSMVRGGKILAAVPFIVLGSVMTAVPSIIEASFVGLGNLLTGAGIAKAAFNPPKCPYKAPRMSDEERYENSISPQTQSSFYPGMHARVQSLCPPTAGSSVCQ